MGLLAVNINLQVPALPDNDVWFINAAAWSNYWQNINLVASFGPVETTLYEPSAYDSAGEVVQDLQIDGVDIFLPSLAMFRSLQAQVAALDASYQDMRTQLKDAGFISTAQ